MADTEQEEEVFEGASAEEQLLGAAKRDRWDSAQALFVDGAVVDTNAKDGLGNTALHYFAQHGNMEAVTVLLSRPGVRIDAQNRQWDTPLHLAADGDHADVVRLLIEKGANPTMANKLKQRPEQLTSSGEIKKMIQSAVFARQVGVAAAASDDDDDGEGEGDADDDE